MLDGQAKRRSQLLGLFQCAFLLSTAIASKCGFEVRIDGASFKTEITQEPDADILREAHKFSAAYFSNDDTLRAKLVKASGCEGEDLSCLASLMKARKQHCLKKKKNLNKAAPSLDVRYEKTVQEKGALVDTWRIYLNETLGFDTFEINGAARESLPGTDELVASYVSDIKVEIKVPFQFEDIYTLIGGILSLGATPHEVDLFTLELCETTFVEYARIKHVDPNPEACFGPVRDHVFSRLAAQKSDQANIIRGFENSFDPPFFFNHHDQGATSSATIFGSLLLGIGTDSQPILNASEPLAVLEIGSFEGGSAAWIAENLLLHPDSRLLCVDSWSVQPFYSGESSRESGQIDDLGSHVGTLVAAIESGTALTRFRRNLAKIPGGRQVVGFKARNSVTALSALIAVRPLLPSEERVGNTSTGLDGGESFGSCTYQKACFDMAYIDGDHKSAEVLADATLAFILLREGGVLIFDDYGGVSPDVRAAVDAFIGTHKSRVKVVWESYILVLVKREVH